MTATSLLRFWDMACSFALGAPRQLGPLAGLEHGRTIPLAPFRLVLGCKRNSQQLPNCFYPSLMLAARITFRHFSASLSSSLAKSAGEPASASPPTAAIRAFMLGSARIALISRLSLSTTWFGVFLGAAMPYRALASKPGTKSPRVGKSGSVGQCVALAIAR